MRDPQEHILEPITCYGTVCALPQRQDITSFLTLTQAGQTPKKAR